MRQAAHRGEIRAAQLPNNFLGLVAPLTLNSNPVSLSAWILAFRRDELQKAALTPKTLFEHGLGNCRQAGGACSTPLLCSMLSKTAGLCLELEAVLHIAASNSCDRTRVRQPRPLKRLKRSSRLCNLKALLCSACKVLNLSKGSMN